MEILRRFPKGGGGGGGNSWQPSSSVPSKANGRPGRPNGAPAVGAPVNNHHESHLPWWVWAIVACTIIFAILFISALFYYCSRERKRKREGKPFRAGHALWKALCIPTGIWLAVWLFRRISHNRKSGGSYTKIEEGHPSNSSNTSSTNAAWYGAVPAQQQHQQQQQQQQYRYSQALDNPGYVSGPVGAKFEPLGYAGAGGATGLGISQARPIVTGPIEQTGSIPLSISSRSPSIMSVETAPPPYVGTGTQDHGVFKPPQMPAPVSQAMP